ncbi:MAG: acyl-CoA dehydrogenase C-terminal domain-containing protein [Geminicoccaceae bacterium]
MVTYRAPLDDIRFCFDMLDYEGRVASLPGHEEAGRELVDAVLEEGARFCEERLLPLNRPGDEEGCTLENGIVRTPAGFKEAYRDYSAAGWVGLTADPEHGGQGLPKAVNTALGEILCSTNLSFAIYPGLSHGGFDAIERWGSDALRTTYLPKLASGEWAATMNLTEPQCGTDLGLIRTRAEPDGEGAFRVTGSKIFISGGDQDLSANIIHLVLARLPDAPPGTKGISLLLVPKFLCAEDGSPSVDNNVVCASLEAKMGIKAAATCAMHFEGAKGWLVGEPHGGMKAMFTMMNEARLMVAMQGIGLAEAAYQSAVTYARERLQGRSLSGPKAPDRAADPIIVHPDVRHQLMTMRALNEGCRALALWVGIEADIAARHADPGERARADDFVALMTPVCKAFFTDHGTDAASRGMQVFGGHGYIREWGMEQLLRDARIAQIYEGTNGIQALDLVGRKLALGNGRLLRRFFHPLTAFTGQIAEHDDMRDMAGLLAKATGRLQQATAVIARRGLADPEEAGAAASDYLRLFALVALAWVWARMVVATAGRDDPFARAKRHTATYYFTRILPETSALFARIMSGKAAVMALDDAAF